MCPSFSFVDMSSLSITSPGTRSTSLSRSRTCDNNARQTYLASPQGCRQQALQMLLDAGQRWRWGLWPEVRTQSPSPAAADCIFDIFKSR